MFCCARHPANSPLQTADGDKQPGLDSHRSLAAANTSGRACTGSWVTLEGWGSCFVTTGETELKARRLQAFLPQQILSLYGMNLAKNYTNSKPALKQLPASTRPYEQMGTQGEGSPTGRWQGMSALEGCQPYRDDFQRGFPHE